MINEVMADAKDRMDKAIEALRHDLMTIRTGRATPALVEHLMVEYYGTPTPLHATGDDQHSRSAADL
jgi:ribosome recycling factor